MDERWQEIERIYHATRELDGSARAAFLARACAGDEALRREVESLLAQADEAESFLEAPPAEMVAKAFGNNERSSNSPDATLEAGTMVAHYCLAGKIGEGGMGEVYRARDTKLQRDVALKILPEAMARDAQRMARFEREAQVLASLNHPNIAAIHGIEESDGIRALVMELVEGETLAEKVMGEGSALPRGPKRLPCLEALPIARQIAEALEYAHERGVIHRDLKPANVKITPEGTVKVLDFGLAKVLSPQGPSSALDPANSPTISAMATQSGMILGTAAYMSPEQAKAKQVDRRCDIWAFGCVLYEMLSGRKAFEGETISDVLVAVLTKEPDWKALPVSTPAAIQRLIHRCLQKDQRQRLQAIGDARIAIEETLSGEANAEMGLAPQVGDDGVRPPLSRALPWVFAATTILFATLTAYLLFQPKAQQPPVRFSVSPPENAVFHPLGGFLSVSPDGSMLAFVAVGKDGNQQLYVRSSGELMAKPIPETDGASWPFWSPDGQYIGFDADGKLKKVKVSGGPAQTLGDASAGGGTWNRDGVIVFANHHVLYRIPEAGGTPSVVAKPDTEHRELYYFPQFLPDGRHFLFCVVGSNIQQGLTKVGSLDSKETQVLLKNVNSTALYASPGYLLYLQDGVLVARRFDAERLRFTADPVSIVEGVAFNSLFPYSYFSVSSNGTLAYQSRAVIPTDQLVWFNRKGSKLENFRQPGLYWNPSISPDGTRLAVGLLDPKTKKRDIWVYDFKRGIGSPITFDPADSLDPVWSPDGGQIIFTSEHRGVRGVYQKSADGLGDTKLRYAHQVQVWIVDDWSPDGRYALYEGNWPRTQLWALDLVGKPRPFSYLKGNFHAHDGRFSPNGRYVAYSSDETGTPEVYVQTFPQHVGKWQVSTSGGMEPQWRHDGNELFYLSPDSTVMSVDVKTSAGKFRPGIPKPLFKAQLVSADERNRYAVSPDGQRFLMLQPAGEGKSAPITVVVNWPALLKNQ